jgi:hypothetical protein
MKLDTGKFNLNLSKLQGMSPFMGHHKTLLYLVVIHNIIEMQRHNGMNLIKMKICQPIQRYG